MKIVIFGDRKINDMNVLIEALEHFEIDIKSIKEVVCGKATGADTLGEEFGNINNIKVTFFEPNWKDITVPGAKIGENKYGKYNKLAGFTRNQQMVDYADIGIALQTNGDTSGTQDCIERFKKSGKTVHIYRGKKSSKASSSQEGGEYSIPF